MTMHEELTWALALAAGGGLGVMFFGGLWWTVHNALRWDGAELWFLGGLALRMSLALTGFYFVAGGRWERLAACVVGFLMARAAVTRLTGPAAPTPTPGASHAP